MSKKCPWCKVDVYLTELKHWYKCPKCQAEFPERAFPKEITVFDRITASPEVLAPHFVFLKAVFVTNINLQQQWISTLTGEVYPTKEEAIAETVAKLNEVCQ